MNDNEQTIWLKEGGYIAFDFSSLDNILLTVAESNGDGYSKTRSSVTVEIDSKQKAVDIAIAVLKNVQHLKD